MGLMNSASRSARPNCLFPDSPIESLAVLVSGGLDSAILLAESLRHYSAVYPLYVRSGLSWEPTELRYLQSFIESLTDPKLQQLTVLEMPLADLYGGHWSLTGQGVPDADSFDEAVYLPGRNVLLLAKTLLWCHLRHVDGLALGVLEANPFPDATSAFFGAYQEAVNRAIGGSVQLQRPFAGLTKVEVLQLGIGLPLERTFSCIDPIQGRHCGRCNKCAERRRAFAELDLADPTIYAGRDTCTA
jgi:7-cyano-7-deazaguanine synthase